MKKMVVLIEIHTAVKNESFDLLISDVHILKVALYFSKITFLQLLTNNLIFFLCILMTSYNSQLSMKNPKWRYEMQPVRRAPRDSNKRAALLEGSRRGSSPPDAVTSGEVTPEEKASPPRDLVSANSICDPPLTESRRSAPSGTANPKRKTTISDKGDDDSAVNNSIVVEATELEEDDKDKLCILCRTAGLWSF